MIFFTSIQKQTISLSTFFKKRANPWYCLCWFVPCLGILGCSSPNLGPLTPPLAQTTPLTVNSRTLSFETNVLGPTTNEDLNFVLNKYESWAHNTFIAQGVSGKAVLTLDSLRVQDTPSTTSSSSEGIFPTAKTRSLSADICIKLVIYSEHDHSHKERFFEGRAKASHTYSQNVTLLEREKILDSISNRLIAALTRQFESVRL